MEIVDTHQHLWDKELFSYSWCNSIPELNRSFRLNDYREATRETDICKTVFLEPDVDEAFILDEALWIFDLAERNPLIAGVVASGRPEHNGFEAYLDKLAGQTKLKGIRRVLHTQPDELSESPTFVDNIRRLEQYALSFDICVRERQLPQAIRLSERCPGVSFILDHCGNPLVKEKVFEPWKTYIKQAASYDNVTCKVSGIVVNADRQHWTPDDLRPYVEHVIECFGWDRVMFGSDWPVCTLAASLKQWVDALALITRGAGEANRRKLFSENAERIYRLR
jgi:predicted TIM-barrel fold metal-dependent hydrolase